MTLLFVLCVSALRPRTRLAAEVERRSVVSKRAGLYNEDELAGPPPSAASLASKALREELRELATPSAEPRKFELSNEAIWKRERSRAQVDAPWTVKIPYYVLCWGLDSCFDGRPIARFWFLETVARMPYFAYISLIHLYESLGWWRRSSEAKRVHFSQEWNEYHHLLVMEALGGDSRWADRFLAQHAAIAYFWILVALWFASPTVAYVFSELIEAHAVDTYSEFLDANEDELKLLPAPAVAKEYWLGNDTLFEDFHINPVRYPRTCDTLYDVFCNIRDDEKEHVCVAHACATPGAKVKKNSDADATSVSIAIAVSAAAFAFAKYFGDAGLEAEAVDVDTDVLASFLSRLLALLPW